jgi:uncharacterized protein (TIGR03067 family)
MRAFWVVFGMGLAGFPVAAVDAAKDAAKAAEAAVEGEWVMVSGMSNGLELPEETVKTAKRTFKAGVTTVEINGAVIMTATATFGEKDKLKTLDLAITEGKAKDKKVLGIYELKGDELKVALGALDGERPTKLESAEGSNVTYTVWKRVKKDK